MCNVLMLLGLLFALSACGKQSMPEPAYNPPPYKSENPTGLDSQD